MKHLIDPLIAERAPWLYRGTTYGAAFRPVLETLLGYRHTLRVAENLEPLSAPEIMDYMADRLAQNVSVAGLHNIPTTGPALIVATHPTGIADGVIMHDVLRRVRRDAFYFANRDILRVLPQMADIIVPVEWRKDKRSHAKTRQTMIDTENAVNAGRLGVIFPSGRLAKRHGIKLYEREWMASAAMIARKFELPVIPIHLSSRNSALFYAFDAIHPTLRDITLFHETLNKSKFKFQVNIGNAIQPGELPVRSQQGIDLLLQRTLDLAENPKKDHSKPIYRPRYKSVSFEFLG